MLKLIISTFCLTSFFFTSSAFSKSSIKEFGRYGNWVISSGHNGNSKKADICQLYAAKTGFNISYTAERGWTLSIPLSKNKRLPRTGQPIVILADGKFVAKPVAEIDNKHHFADIDVGLNTKILNPIFRAKKYVVFVVNKARYVIPIRGINKAYKITLDCWRLRMGSAPYVEKRKNERSKALREAQLLLMAKVFMNAIGFQSNAVRIIDGHPRIFIDALDGKELQAGTIGQFRIKAKRLSPQEMIRWIDRLAAIGLEKCTKVGIDKSPPYFSSNNSEVHYREIICAGEDGPIKKHYIWLVQSQSWITQFVFSLPYSITEELNMKQKRPMEDISYFLK